MGQNHIYGAPDAPVIVSLLEQRHQGGWIFVPEFRWRGRFLDAWAMRSDLAAGVSCVAYEVKTRKGDVYQELARPEKRAPALEISNEYYIVAPAGLVVADRLPAEVGLVSVVDGNRLTITKRAEWREIAPTAPWTLVAAVGSRTSNRSRDHLVELRGALISVGKRPDPLEGLPFPWDADRDGGRA